MSANRVPLSYWRLIGGLFVIGSIALITYSPALKMNFRLLDDNTNLHRAGTLPATLYFTEALDPRLQSISYRPVGLILLWIAYNLFHANASYYHFLQLLLHLSNALLIFGIVWRLGNRWRLALLSASLFAGLPVASEAVFWISEQTPLSAFFSLVAVFFWVLYLQTRRDWHYIVALTGLVLGLLSRESAVVVPIAFFLIDSFFFPRERHWRLLLGRYVPIAMILMLYLIVEYSIQLRGLHVQVGGYSIGWHILSNYLTYVSMLVLQEIPETSSVQWVLAAGLVLLGVTISLVRWNRVLVFLVALIFLTLSPVVSFTLGVTARYLYLTTLPWSILLALLFESLWKWRRLPWLQTAVPVLFAVILVLDGFILADDGEAFAETIRQSRVPFRDIMLQHPMFPSGTRLFLIEPPNNPPMSELAGMFFLRYGQAVSVSGTFEDGRPYTYGRLKAEKANLRDYAHAFVFYFDESNRPIENPVNREANIHAAPVLPAKFQSAIQLEGFEVANSTIRRGQPLVLILYWRAGAAVDYDFKVFVHLLDSKGDIVVGEDSFPRNGKEKTSRWKINQFTADAHVISVPNDAMTGDGYRLEVGLYEFASMQRLELTDKDGLPVGDKITLGPIRIDE